MENNICLSFIGFEGEDSHAKRQKKLVDKIVAKHNGLGVGTGPGVLYDQKKFDTPYLRDFLLDRGAAGDVSETAMPWSKVTLVHDAAIAAAHKAYDELGIKGWIMSHMSHSYHSGACLYFTFAFVFDKDPLGEYDHVKSAIQQAFVDNGSSISHHHGVGLEHAPWLEQDISAEGVKVVSGLFSVTDPGDNLNPRKIIADATRADERTGHDEEAGRGGAIPRRRPCPPRSCRRRRRRKSARASRRPPPGTRPRSDSVGGDMSPMHLSDEVAAALAESPSRRRARVDDHLPWPAAPPESGCGARVRVDPARSRGDPGDDRGARRCTPDRPRRRRRPPHRGGGARQGERPRPPDPRRARVGAVPRRSPRRRTWPRSPASGSSRPAAWAACTAGRPRPSTSRPTCRRSA